MLYNNNNNVNKKKGAIHTDTLILELCLMRYNSELNPKKKCTFN